MGRELTELEPKVQLAARAAIAECEAQGLHALVSCTYRSGEEQNALYAQGRTKPGRIVTRSKAGQSFHQYRVALDLYPLVNGKPDFTGTAKEWKEIATIFKKHGFEWAGEWKRFKEEPHFQIRGGHDLAHFQNGGKL